MSLMHKIDFEVNKPMTTVEPSLVSSGLKMVVVGIQATEDKEGQECILI